MAFSDPQSITINAVAQSLPLIKREATRSTYVKADESVKLILSHQDTPKRTRTMIRAEQRKVASDPLTSVNEYKSLSVYVVIDRPEYGFDSSEIDYLVQGLKTWLSSGNVVKLVGGEH